MAIHIRDILKSKSDNTVWCIEEDRPVLKAVRLMSDKGIGALLVVESQDAYNSSLNDGSQKITGIMTERDYARKVILKDRSSKDTLVSEIMNTDVLYVTPDDSAECSMALMTDRKIRHLPVLEDDQLVGIVSMGDIVKSLISDREFLIDQLLCYITGTQNIESEFVYKEMVNSVPYRVL
jgi:signal-transduction protein with cAMP-binding, CBS, and nucleotidyltransferase domain